MATAQAREELAGLEYHFHTGLLCQYFLLIPFGVCTVTRYLYCLLASPFYMTLDQTHLAGEIVNANSC
jgi:hypothetical protein